MVYAFFDEKSSESGLATEPNYQLENELHRQIIRKFKRRKVYSSFRDNMQSLRKYNKGIRYLLCSIGFFSKYAWAVPLKDKRGITVVNVFQNIIPKGRKPNNIWFDQCGKFYNYLFKRFLKNVQ